MKIYQGVAVTLFTALSIYPTYAGTQENNISISGNETVEDGAEQILITDNDILIEEGLSKEDALLKIKWYSDSTNINNVFSDSDGKIYRTTKKINTYVIQQLTDIRRGNWTDFVSGFSELALSPTNQLTLINNKGEVYEARRDGRDPKKVTGGASNIIASPEGNLWAVSEDMDNGEGNVWLKTNNKWQMKSNFKAKKIVQLNGYLWALDKNGYIHRSESNQDSRILSSAMKKLPGRARDISVGNDDSVVVIGTDNKLYLWSESEKNWLVGPKAPSNAAKIAMLNVANILIVNKDGRLYRGY